MKKMMIWMLCLLCALMLISCTGNGGEASHTSGTRETGSGEYGAVRYPALQQ